MHSIGVFFVFAARYCGAKTFDTRLRVVIALLFGGNWNNAANCGSRSRNANNVRSHANTNIGGRGAIRRFKGMAQLLVLK